MGKPQREIEDPLAFAGRVAYHVRRLRRSRGWTYQDAAERIGVSVPHLYRIEGGKHPMITGNYMDRIADAFGIDASELVRRPRLDRRAKE